jgi:hypothetical protein
MNIREELISKVMQAIAETPEYWTRRNKEAYSTTQYEVCYHSDPEAVSPVVVQHYPTYEEAEDVADVLTTKAQAIAAIKAVLEASSP